MLSRKPAVSHIETHIALKLLPLQPMKLSWKCFIQNHWRAFRPQTSHHKSQKIQSFHLPLLPETSNISASKWRLTSLSKCAASLGSVESNSIFGASSKENLTRSGSQSCCIFPVKEIDFTTRLKHPLAFPTLKNTIRPKVGWFAWVLKFAKPNTVCLKYYVPLNSLSTSSKGKESQWTWPPRVQSPRVPLVQVQHWSIGVCQEQWVLCVEIWVKSSGIGMRKLRRFPLQLNLEMVYGKSYENNKT